MESIQSVMASMGLGQPWVRGLVFGGAMALYLFIIKPSSSYNADGSMKAFISSAGDNGAGRTVFHPIVLIAIAAFVGAFIF